jgi:hypothetical protein
MKDRIIPYLRGAGPPRCLPPVEECTVLIGCDQCGRRARFHLCGGRAFCSRCCPACARRTAIASKARRIDGQRR